MLSENVLPTLNDAKKKREDELYIFGTIYMNPLAPSEEKFPDLLNPFMLHPIVAKNTVVMGNSVLNRYRTPRSMRMLAKERMLSKLQLYPNPERNLPAEYAGNIPDLKQLPFYWPELAGFTDTPITSTMSTSSSLSAERGFWGELSNIITKVGEFAIGYETAKTKATVTEAEAALAEAKAKQQASAAAASVTGNLPAILLAGGIVVVIAMTMQKKRR